MGQVTRLNIDAAISNLKNSFGVGLQRQRPPYAADDLREYMKAVGRYLLPDKFTIDQDNSYVYENVRRWVDADPDFEALNPETSLYEKGDVNKGIFIAGPTGSGKSMLLKVMSRYAEGLFLKMSIDGRAARFCWQSYRADEICQNFARTGELDQYIICPILFIDDAGSEQKETLYMGNRVEVIRTILERRGDNLGRCLTLITSNIPMTKLEYGDRVISRLFQMCNYYKLGGKDRRR